MGVRTMGGLGEVALFLALFLLLGILHGTRAQYDPVAASGPWDDFDDYREADYDYVEDDDDDDYYEEEAEPEPEPVPESTAEEGSAPTAGAENEEFTPMCNNEGTHIDLRSDKLFFFEEAEGTNHSLTIGNLEFETTYEVFIEVFNPHGGPLWGRRRPEVAVVTTPPEPCREASVPHPDKFVESSENSVSVHLDGWQDTNCRTVHDAEECEKECTAT